MITAHQKQVAAAFFLMHPLRQCPVCGTASGFRYVDIVFAVSGHGPAPPEAASVESNNAIPLLLASCANCQFVLSFAARLMGIVA